MVLSFSLSLGQCFSPLYEAEVGKSCPHGIADSNELSAANV